MKHAMLGVAIGLGLVFLVFVSNLTNYEIIKPAEGVECIVAGRLFVMSIDCWQTR